jgi:TRAP-type C4-dicarboxylate transport system substrate-binding protein
LIGILPRSIAGDRAVTFRRSLLAACAATLLGGLPLSAQAADFVLRFGSINLSGTPAFEQVLAPFAHKVEEASGNRIEVALKPMGGYGKPADLFNMTERGDIEIAATVQGYNPGRFPRSSVMELPMMFDTAKGGTEAMWKLYKEGLIDQDYASVKVLGLYVLPPYGIFTSGRSMQTARDLRGMRIRTPGPTVGLALARLGMIPLGIPVDMIGESLSNGTVDAITYGWDSLTTSKGVGDGRLIDLVKVAINVNFAAPALMVVMNRAKWEALPPDLQAVIEAHAGALTHGNAQLRDEGEAATKARMNADPKFVKVTLTDETRADIEKAVTPAIADWKASMTRQGIDGERLYARARELVRQFHTAQR